MDDLIGRKIGGYEIVELIGHGGMAGVYRARQISMNRIVAVKVLPRQFMHDDTYMQRFNREVKIVAELEHRNIVPVHDYGEADGQPYIVMRYMSGGSLDDRLRQGALPLSEITSILDQIGPALDYAHSKGVLHRDLKPSNILMDGSGGAFLTDFGIARLMGEASNVTLTTHGVVGTPSYMSPEQAQGQNLDSRSDVYSLGVMLFEMATGKRPFESDTPYGVAVLQVTARPPSPRSINLNLPITVERVILTTMSKKREDRYPTATQLAEALKVAADAPASALFDTQPVPRPAELAPGEPVRLEAGSTPPPPNNAAAVYTPPPSSLYGTPLVRQRLRPRRSGNLWINIGVGGLIGCALLVLIGLVVLIAVSGILRSSQATATATANIPGGIASPLPLTATKNVAVLATTLPAPSRTNTAATATTATAVIPVGQRDTPAPLTNGTIVYFAERDNNFDIYKMNLNSRVEIRLTSGASSELYPAVSPDGSQIAFMSDADGDYDIYLMDVNGGSVRRLTNNAVDDRLPSWSPDGHWVAFSSDTRGDGSLDLYQVRADGSDLRLLYSDGQRNTAPRYSADGRYVVFTGGAIANGATWEIRRLEVDTGTVINLTNNDVKDELPAFAPDGSVIYLTEGDGHAAIARVGIDGGASRIVYDGAGYDWGARYSPAGNLITFTSDVSGRDELYLMNADGKDVRAVTDSGGMGAEWLPS